MSNLYIKAFDKTGGWNLDAYSAQKGHLICFESSFPVSCIDKIVWKFRDDQEKVATESNPSHIFVKKLEDGSFVPGEGCVTVELYLTTKNNRCYSAKREILIVPVVNCQLQFQDYQIGCETKFITIVGHPLCAVTIIGNPFENDSEPGYACGGACLESCPQYETYAGPLIGNKIFTYGYHCIKAYVWIGSRPNENQNCTSLYANNFLGKNAKYPPLERCFCIEPRNLAINVQKCGSSRWFKKFVIYNFSQHMLPSDGLITWKIANENGKLFWTEKNRCKTLCYEFRRLDSYCIEASIYFSNLCEPKIVKVYLKLVQHCSDEFDIVVQPEIQI